MLKHTKIKYNKQNKLYILSFKQPYTNTITYCNFTTKQSAKTYLKLLNK